MCPALRVDPALRLLLDSIVADRLRGKASDGVTILRADFSDRSVLVPLARETRTAGGVPSLYGWASG